MTSSRTSALCTAGGGIWHTSPLRGQRKGQDGITPGAGTLLLDKFGNLYGTTETGNCCGGVVYELTKQGNEWKETIVYSFQGGSSGNQPYAGVVMDSAGNLYGTTDGGGSDSGCGVIYKLAPTGQGKWKYSVLHRFGASHDGCAPAGNLAIDSNGNLYGGTALGGLYGGGVVFELTP
jgi:uncharacterized repeat protein (TIGR03803 family)